MATSYKVVAGDGVGYYGTKDDYEDAYRLLESLKYRDPQASIEPHEYESLDEKAERLERELETIKQNIQSGNLVEVVRCHECKSLEANAKLFDNNLIENAYWCHEHDKIIISALEYCSYGERV